MAGGYSEDYIFTRALGPDAELIAEYVCELLQLLPQPATGEIIGRIRSIGVQNLVFRYMRIL